MLLLAALCSIGTGCSDSESDPNGQCPCDEGWVCDETTNRCVPEPDVDIPPDPPEEEPDAPTPTNPVVSLAAGGNNTCALFEDGSLKCWGSNSVGQLGYGGTDVGHIGNDETPASMPSIDVGGVVKHVAVGETYICAALSDGKIRCWGLEGLTSPGDAVPSSQTAMDVGGKVMKLAAGSAHTCALLEDSTIRCWGYAVYGQLGYGNIQDIDYANLPGTAGAVSVGGPVADIAAGIRHTCAALENGHVRCWGSNYRGALGYPGEVLIGDVSLPSDQPPVLLLYQSEFGILFVPTIALSVGTLHGCSLHATGELACWGANSSDQIWSTDRGQLGYGHGMDIGDNEQPATSVGVKVGSDVLQVATGDAHTCALLVSGNVRCWGGGTLGQLGYGNASNIGDDEVPSTKPTVDVGGKVKQVVAGNNHTCALLENGDVRCWGYGEIGQLGYGNPLNVGVDEVPSSLDPVPLQ